MIRINLLGIRKEVARAPAVSVEGAKLTVLLVIVLVAAVGVLVVDWQRISSQKAKLDKRKADAQTEKARLEGVKRQYGQNLQNKQTLEQRINIIQELENKKTGPVRLLNTVVNTVELSTVEDNKHLWLTSFSSRDGRVDMGGMADSVKTVANFITNLQSSGRFKSVEIRESYQEDRVKDFPTFVFSLNADLAPLTTPDADGTAGMQ
jgi:Tfp pilus assembly protein PilN